MLCWLDWCVFSSSHMCCKLRLSLQRKVEEKEKSSELCMNAKLTCHWFEVPLPNSNFNIRLPWESQKRIHSPLGIWHPKLLDCFLEEFHIVTCDCGQEIWHSDNQGLKAVCSRWLSYLNIFLLTAWTASKKELWEGCRSSREACSFYEWWDTTSSPTPWTSWRCSYSSGNTCFNTHPA
jgi:hypothetical protein